MTDAEIRALWERVRKEVRYTADPHEPHRDVDCLDDDQVFTHIFLIVNPPTPNPPTPPRWIPL